MIEIEFATTAEFLIGLTARGGAPDSMQGDWNRLFDSLGFCLPWDYVRFIEQYGFGEFSRYWEISPRAPGEGMVSCWVFDYPEDRVPTSGFEQFLMMCRPYAFASCGTIWLAWLRNVAPLEPSLWPVAIIDIARRRVDRVGHSFATALLNWSSLAYPPIHYEGVERVDSSFVRSESAFEGMRRAFGEM